MRTSQHGYLSVIAVLLIVVIGFIGVSAAYLIISSASATNNLAQSTGAFYLAESGLERAIRVLDTSNLTFRNTCAALNLSDSLAGGVYSVTGAGPYYVSSPTTLSSAITASATTIPVVSTANYQSVGRIMIDRETIDYLTVGATSFVAVVRGADGTTASAHALGAPVGQFQCALTSVGGMPSLTLPANYLGGKRVLTEAVQLQEGWAVGNKTTTWNMTHWNTPNELQWTLQIPSLAGSQDLRAISVVSNVDAWAVGVNAVALRFNGSTWANINSGITSGDDLLSVSAVSSTEAWAGTSQGRLYKWSGGSAWASVITISNSLNGISMLDTNGDGAADIGWVVGDTKTAYIYNGTSWTTRNTGITVQLNSVSTVSASDAFAAGNTGRIFRWTGGSSWSLMSTPSSTPTLRSISMISFGSSVIGWAVGTASTAWYYNGTSWSSAGSGLAGSLNITGVVTISDKEAWLVDASRHIYEWNGSSWTLVSTQGDIMNGIDMVHPNSKPASGWRENFA